MEIAELNDHIHFLSVLAKDGDSLNRLYTENKELAKKILDLEARITRLTQERDQEIQKIKSEAEATAQRKQIKYEREIKRFKEAAETAYGKGKTSALKSIAASTASPPKVRFIWNRETKALYLNNKQQRLENALSDDLKKRFLALPAFHIGDNMFISVNIDPSTPLEHEKGSYTTSLTTCNCNDFRYTLKRQSACKHMFALALHLGLITEQGEFVENPDKK